MNYTRYYTLSIFAIMSSVTAGWQIRPKAGVELGMLTLGQNDAQDLPFLDFNGDVTFYYPYTNADNNTVQEDANPAYFGRTTPVQISSDNVDGVNFTHLLGGIEIGYYDETMRPSSTIQIAPIANIYIVAEDTNEYDIHNHAYVLKSLTSAGIDLGLLATNNGNSIKIGGGARAFRGEYNTSSLFAIIANVKAHDENNNDLDISTATTQFNAEDKEPFIAKTKPIFMPYAYAEISTEIGDIATVFTKGAYGFKASPEFDEVPESTQMFSGDSNKYANNSDWRYHSISLGLQVRMSSS